MREKLSTSGVDVIGEVSWGAHICQFYQTKEDLIEVLIPYFKAGLENNEFCVWVTSQLLEVNEAKEILKKVISDFDVYLEKGQIEILSYTDYYLIDGIFDSKRVFDDWIKKLNLVLSGGYNGLRVSGDTSWLEKKDWNSFSEYEEKVDSAISNYRTIALCTYSLDRLNTIEIIDVVANHQFSLVKREGKWKRIESSKRKKTEEAALQATKNWEYTFDAVPDLIAILDTEFKIVRANRAMAARLGVTPEECIGLTCCNVIHGTDKPPSFCPHLQLLKDGLEHTREVCEDNLGGEFIVSVSPLFNAEGKIAGCIHVARDITGRKRAEEALRESEKKYRNFIETAIEGILIVDVEAKTTYANEKMAEMLGYSQEEMIGKFAWDFADEEGKTIIKQNMEKRRQGIYEIYELRLIRKDGSPLWGLISAKGLFDKAARFTGSMAMVTDITKRKEAETRLKETLDNLEELVKKRTIELESAYEFVKESEKGLAEAQKMAHIGNWELDIKSDNVYWSDELYRIFKRSQQELAPLYDEYLSYVHPDDRDYVIDTFGRAVNKGEPYSIEHRIILANGEERTIYKQSEVVFDEENTPVGLKGIVQDITERKKAEQALELSEERYRLVTEQTGQLVYDYNLEKDRASLTGNVEELTGFTPEEFGNKSLKFWLSRVHSEDLDIYVEKHRRYRESGDVYRTEYRFRKKNKEYVYFEDNGVFLKDKKGNVNRILGVIKDITERKKAEIFLANIETARKKEIHHRIKNNLQVISSLLDLQAEKFRGRKCVEDSEVLKAFRESQDRVMSIALIHEELHEGRGTDKLNFSPYLERLINNLFQTYWLGNASTGLNIELEKDIFFDMDIAVPLGIIINELVSNALKYAFQGKDKGLIEIKLFREDTSENASNWSGSEKEGSEINFILTVSDNGVGIPVNFNSDKSETLGLQLVVILVDQLGGKLELKRDSGTEFIIKFKVEEK